MNSVRIGFDGDLPCLGRLRRFLRRRPPPTVDVNGYGIRVPLIVSARTRNRDNRPHHVELRLNLKFIEDRFLGGQRIDPVTDGRADTRPTVREAAPQAGDLREAFDFAQVPRDPLILPTVATGAELAEKMPAIPRVARPARRRSCRSRELRRSWSTSTGRRAPARHCALDSRLRRRQVQKREGCAARRSIAHTYGRAGGYEAVLTVRQPSGAHATARYDVLVAGPPPTAWIYGVPAQAFSSAHVSGSTLSASDSGAWTIDFGDGSSVKSGFGVPPSLTHHTYAAPGLYVATLTVTDADGQVSIARGKH